jgi:hypothetical protein
MHFWKNHKIVDFFLTDTVFFQEKNQMRSNKNIKMSMTTGIKTLLALLCIHTISCMKLESYGCVDCMSVAIRIELQDSQDSGSITNAKIIAINKAYHDTIVVDSLYLKKFGDSDSSGHYAIYGFPGEYSLNISHPLYNTFIVNSINVTQWTEVTCEHANTENLIIRLDKLHLNKNSDIKSNGILSQITNGHC